MMNTDDVYVDSLSWSRDAYNVLINRYILLHICKLFDCLFKLLTFILKGKGKISFPKAHFDLRKYSTNTYICT